MSLKNTHDYNYKIIDYINIETLQGQSLYTAER